MRLTWAVGARTFADMETVHGTIVARQGIGVLLQGPSGAGKSDLALRLIDRGWDLVADDQVRIVSGDDGALHASAPENLTGMIEIRGLGIVRIGAIPAAIVHLAVHLVPQDDVPRMPDLQEHAEFAGRPLPLIRLNGHTVSAPLVVERALDVVTGKLKRVT